MEPGHCSWSVLIRADENRRLILALIATNIPGQRVQPPRGCDTSPQMTLLNRCGFGEAVSARRNSTTSAT